MQIANNIWRHSQKHAFRPVKPALPEFGYPPLTPVPRAPSLNLVTWLPTVPNLAVTKSDLYNPLISLRVRIQKVEINSQEHKSSTRLV